MGLPRRRRRRSIVFAGFGEWVPAEAFISGECLCVEFGEAVGYLALEVVVGDIEGGYNGGVFEVGERAGELVSVEVEFEEMGELGQRIWNVPGEVVGGEIYLLEGGEG